jgi:5-methylcytosine-specific restriction protein A
MSLADLTKGAVEAALAEYDTLGRDAFLTKYGFADAKRYWIDWQGKQYPSKAIAGVAHKHVDGQQLLPSASFTGGEGSVVRKLRQLGFVIAGAERNPAWNRDELILALDLYMTNPASPPGKTSSEVAALSALLNKMHRLSGTSAAPTLRNANGVYLKMMNLRSLDPKFTAQGKVGMQSGGALEKVVWADYAGQREKLAADAAAIREAVGRADEARVATLPPAEPYEGEEGGVIMRLHKRYERDPKLIAEKRKAAKSAGAIACEVCGFDFHSAYGELGSGYIEVHHTKPVHTMKAGHKTKLEDLALLCANCHRMAHRKRVPLSLAEIIASLKPAMVSGGTS